MTHLALRIATTFVAKKNPLTDLMVDESPYITEDLERASKGGVRFGPLKVGDWKQGEIRVNPSKNVTRGETTWTQTFEGKDKKGQVVVQLVAFHRIREGLDPALETMWEVQTDEGTVPHGTSWEEGIPLDRGIELPRTILRAITDTTERLKQDYAAGLR